MTEDDVADTHRAQHICRDLTGERTGLLPVAVLCGNADVGARSRLEGGGQIHKGNAHDHVAGRIRDERLDRVDQFGGFRRRLVHFPVAGNNVFTHAWLLLII